MSTNEFFDTVLPELLTKHSAKAQAMNARINVVLTGEGGGEWCISCKSGANPSCTVGKGSNVDATLTASVAVFNDILNNPSVSKGMGYYASKKITVQGSLMKVLSCMSKIKDLTK